jgi:hypothetical protein
VLLEKNMLRRSRAGSSSPCYALFSPQSLIAEGTANYGIEVAFPGGSAWSSSGASCFRCRHLKPENARSTYEVLALVDKLSYAGNEAARRYLDGRIDARAAADAARSTDCYSRPRAEQRVRFVDQYRSYVINYNLGRDMVAAYIESRGRDRWGRVRAAHLVTSPAIFANSCAQLRSRNRVLRRF